MKQGGTSEAEAMLFEELTTFASGIRLQCDSGSLPETNLDSYIKAMQTMIAIYNKETTSTLVDWAIARKETIAKGSS